MELTQTDLTNLLKILDNQSIAINNLSKRLIEAEILISSITDVILEKNIIANEDLLEMMTGKIDIINTKFKIEEKRRQRESELNSESMMESYPYFGKPGEA
jgi:hypothetical protein